MPACELEPPDPLEGPLGDHALAGDRVADHPEREHLDRDQGQDRAEDQRLDVAGSVAVEDPVEQERGEAAISAATPNTQATIVNTRSGSYRT